VNRIERWFRIIKVKLKHFYNRFPANTTIKPIERLLEAFIAIYN